MSTTSNVGTFLIDSFLETSVMVGLDFGLFPSMPMQALQSKVKAQICMKTQKLFGPPN